MKRFSTLKQEARTALRGKWMQFALLSLLLLILNGVFSLPGTLYSLAFPHTTPFGWGDGITLVLSLVYAVVTWGFTVMLLRNLRDPQFDELGALFDGFRQFGRIFTTLLLQFVYTMLWMLLLIVPGIVKAYSYSMTPYILYDRPDLQRNAAIELSMRMMRGHKMELFLLHLSFIGWFLLCVVTLGIGLLWLIPYVETTVAAFYEDLKAEYTETDDNAGESADAVTTV